MPDAERATRWDRLNRNAFSMSSWLTETRDRPTYLDYNMGWQDAPLDARAKLPVFAWPLLVAAVLAVSSAAAVFSKMSDVPAITLAAWRLQLTSLVLLPGAVVQYRRLEAEDQQRTLKALKLMLISGTCLAIHFGAWVWGLQHTSLPHSVLFVSTSPLLLAASAWLLRKPISWGETGGALLGFAGCVLLAWGSASGSATAAGIWGDLASFLAAVAFCGYITVGRDLRSWMPIFVYTFPVTFTAALLLSFAGLAIDRHEFIGASHQGILGWTTSAHYAPYVVYLALGPGLVGHTGFNTLLRYMTPLTISLACQLETVMAPLIGWLLSVSAMPESITYIGGAIVLAATMIVTVSSNSREQQEEARQAGFVALGNMFQTYSALQTDEMDALQGGMDDQLADDGDGEDWVAKA